MKFKFRSTLQLLNYINLIADNKLIFTSIKKKVGCSKEYNKFKIIPEDFYSKNPQVGH